MKKRWIVPMGLLVLISLIGCSNQTPSNNQPTPDSNATQKTIGIEEARQIALEHAKVKPDEVTFITAEKEIENGAEYIDVEFYFEGREYDYEIEVATGKIARYDNNVEDFQIPNDKAAPPDTQATLNMAEAKQIALKHAELQEVNVNFIREEEDYEKGVLCYEVEFKANNIDYEYKIDANTGEIIEFSNEKY